MNGKGSANPRLAVHLDGAVMGFDNRFGKGKSKADSLGVLRETAAIKTFENMGEILRGDAISVIFYGDLNRGCKMFPFQADVGAAAGVVEGIFYKIADGFHEPAAVTPEGYRVVTGQRKFLMFLSDPVGEMLLNASHHVGYLLHIFFHDSGPGVKSGDFQKVLYQHGDSVQLLLGQSGKFLDGR